MRLFYSSDCLDRTRSPITGENSKLVHTSPAVCLGDRIKAGQSWKGPGHPRITPLVAGKALQPGEVCQGHTAR